MGVVVAAFVIACAAAAGVVVVAPQKMAVEVDGDDWGERRKRWVDVVSWLAHLPLVCGGAREQETLVTAPLVEPNWRWTANAWSCWQS